MTVLIKILSTTTRSLAALAVVSALCAPAFAQDAEKQAAPPATAVGMDKVRTEPLSQTVPVIGRLVAKQGGVVAARIAGPVEAYMAEVGDTVNVNATLATIVEDTFQVERSRRRADVATAKAQLETSRASLHLLEQELDRLDRLRTSPAFSQARYDDKHQETVRARSQVTEASSAVRAAEAELQLAEIELRDTVIRAPFGGTITQRHSEAGSYLRVGDPVVTLLDNHNLEIEADVPANLTTGLEGGRPMRATLDTGADLNAIVRAVIPDENPRTRTRRARFIVDLPEGMDRGAAINQSVTVYVPAGETGKVVTVHKDAVLNRNGGQLVIVNDAGMAAFRPVRLGQAVGQRFVVQSGLNDGDEVVVRGNERLRPGQAITPSASAAPKAEGSGS